MPTKGSQKANHKYVKRRWKNGKWQYYYKNQASVSRQAADLWNQVTEYNKQAELDELSSKQHANKLANTKAGTPSLSGVKSAYKEASSSVNRSKAKSAQKQLDKLYTEARNGARAVQANSGYQKQLQKNAKKALEQNPTYIRKNRVTKAKNKALKRQAIKNSIKYKLQSGKLKVKNILKALRR